MWTFKAFRESYGPLLSVMNRRHLYTYSLAAEYLFDYFIMGYIKE